jgi:hypothetical protein
MALLAVIGDAGLSGQMINGLSVRVSAQSIESVAHATSLSPAARAREEDLASGLKSLSFLLGDWDAVPGAAGETGAFSFRSGVQGRVIIRTNYANYPAANGKPASRHDDLMVIAVDGETLRADYFDTEGHVIRYVVESPAAGQVTFLSEVKPNEPRYRLRYTANADGTLAGQFDIAPTGKTESFNPFLTWSARHAR